MFAACQHAQCLNNMQLFPPPTEKRVDLGREQDDGDAGPSLPVSVSTSRITVECHRSWTWHSLLLRSLSSGATSLIYSRLWSFSKSLSARGRKSMGLICFLASSWEGIKSVVKQNIICVIYRLLWPLIRLCPFVKCKYRSC